MDLKLTDLGISEAELREQLLERATQGIVDAFVHDEEINSVFKGIVEEAADASAERASAEVIGPLFDTGIESVILQQTTRWGDAVGEPVTFREYLVQRAEGYLVERVDFEGKTEKESRHHQFKASQTRIAYMIDQHLQYHITTMMKDAMGQVNAALAEGVAEAVKIKIGEVADSLKLTVDTGR